jgi:SnoaL-like domain
MNTSNVALAEEYYTLFGEKNAEGIKKYLHADVELHGPLGTAKGKEAVFETTSNFINVIKSLKIRAKFGAGDQVMIVHDSDIPGIVDSFPGAVLLNFHDGLIIRIELFYDGGSIVEKKEEIFS